MLWLFPLALLIIFEALADIFAKQWSLRQHSWLWLAAIASYVVGNLFWLVALKHGSGLARGGMIFSVVSAILVIAIGLVLYKESLNKIQILGLVIGLISLVLIFW